MNRSPEAKSLASHLRYGFVDGWHPSYNNYMVEPGRASQMHSEEQVSESTIKKLRELRTALLHLHKTLLEFEREGYERVHGKIDNSYRYLNLVMQNPWFAWLRHLSELIVQMDELLDTREPVSETTAAALIEQARILLTPNETGPEFQRKYFASVQRSPEVVLAHAEFARVLGPGRLSREVH
jgi:hypothetical protein